MLLRSSVAAAAVLCAGMASAQPFTELGVYGGWFVYQNDATGNCTMQRVTQQEIAFEAGLLDDRSEEAEEGDKIGYIAIWIPFEPPEGTELQAPFASVEVNGNTYVGEARIVTRDDGYWGGVMTTNDQADIAVDLIEGDTLTVRTVTGEIAIMDLTRSDTEAAIEAVIACEAMGMSEES